MSAWDLPGPPVNESWQPSPAGRSTSGSTQDLLTNLTDELLVYERLGGTALRHQSWSSANGQYRCFSVPGNFSIARPCFSGFDNSSSLVGFVWSSPVLHGQHAVGRDGPIDL